jgi:hypothetical protein
MITVVVLINGQPIFTRSARNIKDCGGKLTGYCEYRVDTGDTLVHKRGEGFVPLAKRMLDTIDELNITNTEGS